MWDAGASTDTRTGGLLPNLLRNSLSNSATMTVTSPLFDEAIQTPITGTTLMRMKTNSWVVQNQIIEV